MLLAHTWKERRPSEVLKPEEVVCGMQLISLIIEDPADRGARTSTDSIDLLESRNSLIQKLIIRETDGMLEKCLRSPAASMPGNLGTSS